MTSITLPDPTTDDTRIEGNRIGGRSVPASRTMPVIDPATGRTLAEVSASSADDVDTAVRTAVRAQPDWAATSPQTRAAVLEKWADLLVEHRETLAATATAEMGKLLAESRGEVDRAVAEIRFMSGEALRLEGQSLPSTRPDTLVVTTRVPLGTIAAITPWNFPIVAPARKLAPALAAGDAVVLKPAAESPLCALLMADLLTEAGLPDGVVAVLSGSGSEAGSALVAHPGIDGISFTGSTAVGRGIAQVAAGRLVPVQLELGGKNAVYVDASADLDRAVADIVSASIQATGQRCTAISRVLVHDSVADELVSRIAGAYDALTLGAGTEPVDVGPLVSAKAKAGVAEYLRGALDEGASLATTRTDAPEGNYLAPAVLDGVRPDMTVAREEVFGPVLSVMRVSSTEEAIEIANDTEYGLAASVFSADIGAALRFANSMDVGMVHINHGTASQAHVPFGGVGGSGLGPYSIGHVAQEFFTKMKVVYVAA